MPIISGNFEYMGLGQRGLTASLSYIYDSGTARYRPLNSQDVLNPSSTSVSNFTPSGTNGNVLPTNVNRKEFLVQNLSTGILYLKLGNTASSNSFNVILSSGTAQNNGLGGVFLSDSWRGPVSVSGDSPRYMVWETQ